MLDEKTLAALPVAICTRLNKLNQTYLEQIGKKVKEIGALSPGDLHKLQRMQTYSEDVETELERITAKNADEIRSIIETVAKDTYGAALPAMTARGIAHIPYEENTALRRYVESVTRQTVGEYINITQHTAFCIFGADGTTKSFFKENSRKIPTSLSDTYTRVIDEAVTAAQMGEIDYQSAMRQTMRALSDCGIRTVDYATGYSRRLDTAVRQNVLWGIKQCAVGTAEQVGEDFGADGWEISYHANPRPSHVAMGGRQYAAGSTGRTVGGKYYPPFSGTPNAPETLLQDYNCLHRKFPILLGISEPAYDEDELAALNARDRQTFVLEGKQYTGYEATQVQRRLETEMRRQKDRANLFAVSGDEDGRRAAQEKLNILTRKYKEFSDAAGLDTHKERMSVSGFHRVKSTSEVARSMRSPLPRGYKDTRTVGTPISADALQSFADKAEKYGIRFAPTYGACGGFESYRGDPRVLDDALEHLKNGKNLLTQRGKDDTILLQYHDILDKNGRIDPDTFAMVSGRTITLNRFMYDDAEHLKREYAALVKCGHFTKGTDYRNVIDHEMGHVLAKRDRAYAKRCEAAVLRLAEESGEPAYDFIQKHISNYATNPGELFAELVSKSCGNDPEFAISILKEATDS